MDLKKEVKRKGLTQKDLARKLNLKQNTISNILNKRIRPTYESILILGDLLDVDVKEILLFYVNGGI